MTVPPPLFFWTSKSLVTKTNKTTAHSVPLWLDFYSSAEFLSSSQNVPNEQSWSLKKKKIWKVAVDQQYNDVSFTTAEWIEVTLDVMMLITQSNWDNIWKWSTKSKKKLKLKIKTAHCQIKSFWGNRFPLTQFKHSKDPEVRCKDVAQETHNQDRTMRPPAWPPHILKASHFHPTEVSACSFQLTGLINGALCHH